MGLPTCPGPTRPGPTPRPGILDIAAYVPGRDHVEGVAKVYKLSSNENPFPPVPEVLQAVHAAAQTMNRYPDMGSTELYSELARHLDVRFLAVAPPDAATRTRIRQPVADAPPRRGPG